MTTTPVTINDLTTGAIDGTGIFDKLMATAKAHLDAEQRKGTIRGPEYSQVYLGQIQAILQTSISFLTTQAKISLEADLLTAQIELTKQQTLTAQAQVDLVRAQIEAQVSQKEVDEANAAKIRAETLNIPKQGLMIEAQTALVVQQKLNAVAELAAITAGKDKTVAETANVPLAGLQITAQTALVTQQKENAIVEHEVLEAQECKLRAEYDLTVNNTLKTTSEIGLLTQKVATERAQTQAMGVDDDSVIGKQKGLYQAQKDGFARDAEQKVAKTLIDTWNARRMTDDATVADGVNKLNDATIGRAVTKLLEGVDA